MVQPEEESPLGRPGEDTAVVGLQRRRKGDDLDGCSPLVHDGPHLLVVLDVHPLNALGVDGLLRRQGHATGLLAWTLEKEKQNAWRIKD